MKRFPRRHKLPSGQLKRALFQCAIAHLTRRGRDKDPDRRDSHVIKMPKSLPSVRTVRDPGAEPGEYATYKTIIRTTQTVSISFTRNRDDTGWAGLQDVQYVTIARLDNTKNPQNAVVDTVAAEQIEERFNEAYAAFKAKGGTLKPKTGFWVPMSDLAGVSVQGRRSKHSLRPYLLLPDSAVLALPHAAEGAWAPLSIPEAKRRLALSHGVPEKNVKITIKT